VPPDAARGRLKESRPLRRPSPRKGIVARSHFAGRITSGTSAKPTSGRGRKRSPMPASEDLREEKPKAEWPRAARAPRRGARPGADRLRGRSPGAAADARGRHCPRTIVGERALAGRSRSQHTPRMGRGVGETAGGSEGRRRPDTRGREQHREGSNPRSAAGATATRAPAGSCDGSSRVAEHRPVRHAAVHDPIRAGARECGAASRRLTGRGAARCGRRRKTARANDPFRHRPRGAWLAAFRHSRSGTADPAQPAQAGSMAGRIKNTEAGSPGCRQHRVARHDR
jgi:hypothetical protein